MRKIFVSYASADRRLAWRLDCDLQLAGANTWLDRSAIQQFDERPDPSELTSYVVERLSEGISSVDALVLVASRNAAASSWVSAEYRAAIEGDLTVCAFVIDEEHSFDLSEIPKGRIFRAIDYEAGLRCLCDELELRVNLPVTGPLTGFWSYQASEYDVANGSVVMVQRGAEVIGRVDYQTLNSGKVIGVLHGDVLRFIWANSLEQGIGYLEAKGGKDHLAGAFIRRGTTEEVPWNLTRVKET